MGFHRELEKFLQQAVSDNLRTQDYPDEYNGLTVKVSFGQGAPARIPWIAFLGKGQSVQKGFYPVYLYYKEQKTLFLAYGLSETKEPLTKWHLAEDAITIEEYFGQINIKPFRYGSSFVYKKYEESEMLDKDTIDKDLDELIEIYKEQLDNVEIVESKFTTEKLKLTQDTAVVFTSIKTKPFIILAGISGTGKSRLVRKLAFDFCTEELKDEAIKKPGNFELVKVRPNWHDSSELLGYESRISGCDRYIFTDFVRFIVKAMHYPEVPFFLCLDEMNLAPVEQYFAEYLSVLETRKLNSDEMIVSDALIGASVFKKYSENKSEVDENYDLKSELQVAEDEVFNKLTSEGLTLPPNLIVMGTVNMDETTHTFSRKVLDRAMTIEMTIGDLNEGLGDEKDAWSYPDVPLIGELIIPGKTDGWQVSEELGEVTTQIVSYLEEANRALAGSPFAIAYRVRDEFLIYAFNYMEQNGSENDWLNKVLDEMTLMKILPRIEGDEEKTSVLEKMIELLVIRKLEKSLAKATEMNERRKANHFTSFWP